MIQMIQKDIRSHADPEKALGIKRYFKTGPGDYGAGDIFIGLTAPQCRKLAKKYQDFPLREIERLLKSEIHEERLIALVILRHRFEKGDESDHEKIFKIYIKNKKHINNWDLVDTSAPNIVGAYLYNRKRDLLFELSRSKSLWDRRIAVLATFYFIGQGETRDSLRMAVILMQDPHDLIHKAVGWMLRELGKRVSERELKSFLDKYATQMPRTMLRYSLERLSKKDRQKYMAR